MFNKNTFKLSSLIVVLIFMYASVIQAQPEKVMNSSQLKIALEKLNVLGSVLYVAAHPDDENNALLAYFTKGMKLRTGYLSLTRGDGGQNLVGTEQGDLLGVLRTQELLAARRIDGAEQFFSRAIDFGYSKSASETMRIWGKDKILSDVVWIIRKFRPDVIITRFPGTGEGGHGNHTASEILAAEAFKISGDPTAFPEQLKYVKPWKAKRIIWNAWLPILKKRGTDLSKLIKIDVGAYDPLLGESFTEIGAESRSMHKSQGFGSSARLGKSVNYFLPIEGSKAEGNLFDGVNITWSRIKGGEKVERLISKANSEFDPLHPEKTIPVLLEAYKEMKNLKDSYWVPIKRKELLNVIRSCAGISIQSFAADYSASPGTEINVTSGIINRSSFPFTLKKVEVSHQINTTSPDVKLNNNTEYGYSSSVKIPDNMKISEPYWLLHRHGLGDYVVDDQRLVGKPENDTPLKAEFFVSADGETLVFTTPVVYRWTDPVMGEQIRPFIIAPPVVINIENKDYVFPNDNGRKINITLTANIDSASGVLDFKLPDNWKVEPSKKPFFIKNKHDELQLTFNITPPSGSSDVEMKAFAEVNGETADRGMVTIDHSYIPVQTVFPPAEANLIRLDVKKVINNIGYIMGPGDKVPDNLRELGYSITMLSDKDLQNGSLSKYDAIITGIRLYNTDKQMEFEQPKLLEYVKNGGTLVVQYNKDFGLVTDKIGPYPFHISRDRVTVEEAPVKFIDPESPLLNYPNKITEKDFDGWVQERGVYFPDSWDPRYKTVIECNDPGEKPLAGGLLYTKYGKGVFIYTGYDWFRELPAGVPGAYRIFVNLISAGKAPNIN